MLITVGHPHPAPTTLELLPPSSVGQGSLDLLRESSNLYCQFTTATVSLLPAAELGFCRKPTRTEVLPPPPTPETPDGTPETMATNQSDTDFLHYYGHLLKLRAVLKSNIPSSFFCCPLPTQFHLYQLFLPRGIIYQPNTKGPIQLRDLGSGSSRSHQRPE